MKISIIAVILFCSLQALAAPRYFMSLTGGRGSSLWLDQKISNGRPIYILGHKSFSGHSVETALPKEDYKNLVQEMTTWMKDINGRRLGVPGLGCAESVFFEYSKNRKIICMDNSSERDKAKFVSWYRKTVQAAIGIE